MAPVMSGPCSWVRSLRYRLQFVHQSQNGRLVRVVDALGLLLLLARPPAVLFATSGACGCPGLHIGQADGAQDREYRRQAQGASAEALRVRLAEAWTCSSSSNGAAARCPR